MKHAIFSDASPVGPYYAGKVIAKRAVAIARASGIDVGGLELRPDGTVAVFDSRTAVAIASKDIGKD